MGIGLCISCFQPRPQSQPRERDADAGADQHQHQHHNQHQHQHKYRCIRYFSTISNGFSQEILFCKNIFLQLIQSELRDMLLP